jgi:ribosome-associated protein
MELAVSTLAEKKARDISVLRTTDLTVLADYFVVASGSSARQLRTLSDEVSHALEIVGEAPLRVEGYRTGGWCLVDFGAIVLHLFLSDVRAFYDLERLWGDAEKVPLDFLTDENRQ